MRASLEPLTQTIKAAREKKGLSQRALSAKIGVPQSHISRIENAEVDLQTSNLIEIARALDLELVLIPRTLLPAVQSLHRSMEPDRASHRRGDRPSAPKPAYRLDDDDDDHG